MITASDAWKDIHQRFLVPEGFIEIECALVETGVQETAVASGTNEAIFSKVDQVLVKNSGYEYTYATCELNHWALDGSAYIVHDSGNIYSGGYVSDIESTGSVTLTLPQVHTTPIPGIAIVWSEMFGEYPTVFTITAKNGDTVVAETTVTDNTETKCLVDLDISNYDSVTVTVHDWSLPHRRVRIDEITFGHVLKLTKDDILSYTHEQHGDLFSSEIPKNSIEFSLDNTSGRWNPFNPSGLEKYLSERQKLTVRYGFDIDGTIEWIKAGTFYLSEWDAPANGMEARFVARDMFEFLINGDMSGYRYDSLEGLVETAVRYSIPEDAIVAIDPSLATYTGVTDEGKNTAAEIVQKCANAAQCVLRYDRDGVLYVEPLRRTLTDYLIPASLSYSHPEITLSKPLKMVSVDYGEDTPYELAVSSTGETQTVSNDFITSEEQANQVAEWIRDILLSRKTVSGEFRVDPRLDLFDIVTVESKYGSLSPVVITHIKYTFKGAFHGSFTGRVLDGVIA